MRVGAPITPHGINPTTYSGSTYVEGAFQGSVRISCALSQRTIVRNFADQHHRPYTRMYVRSSTTTPKSHKHRVRDHDQLLFLSQHQHHTFVSTKGTLTARAAVSLRACFVGLWLSPTAMRTWELCVWRVRQQAQDRQRHVRLQVADGIQPLPVHTQLKHRQSPCRLQLHSARQAKQNLDERDIDKTPGETRIPSEDTAFEPT